MKIRPYIGTLLVLISSCASDSDADKVDTKIPVIELQDSNPGHADGQICGTTEEKVFTLSSAQTLELSLEFSDDIELSQYKIDIHNNFDCHSHGRVNAVGEPWFVTRIEKLESNHKLVTERLIVLENVAAGDYHLQIYCLDKVGNEAEPLLFSMKITNNSDSEAPLLALIQPAESGVTLNKGATLTLNGTVNDNTDLAGGRIEVFYYDPQQTLFTVLQFFFPRETDTNYTFTIPYNFSSSAPAGTYNFHIKAYDQYNNASEKIIPVRIE